MFAVTVTFQTVWLALACVALIVVTCLLFNYAVVKYVVMPRLDAWKEREIAKVNAKYGDEGPTGSEQ